MKPALRRLAFWIDAVFWAAAWAFYLYALWLAAQHFAHFIDTWGA